MRRRELVAALAGAAVVLVVAGSVAWAAIPGDGGVYTACMLKGKGTIRLIDKSLPPGNLMSHCKPSTEVEVTWNQQGPQGLPGTQGVPGPKGDTGDKGDTGAQGPAGQQGQRGLPGQDGAQGLKGDPCLSTDPACVGPPGSVETTYRGPWSARQYAHGDIVTHNGSLWMGVLNPPALEEPGNSQLWDLLAAKGAAGAPGQAGPQGPKGDKGDRGDTGAQGAPGPAGISGHEIIPSWSGFLGPFQSFTVGASCSAGKRVLGGGYYGTRILADKDYPDGGSRWSVAGSAGASGGELTVYAICANVSI